MDAIAAKVAKMREREQGRHQEDKQARERMLRADEEKQRAFNQTVRPLLSRATAQAYNNWLIGFMTRGGEPTHCYDYPMPDSFYEAVGDFELPQFFGTLAVHIIVPTSVKVAYDRLGHNTLYLMDGFDYKGDWVPLYADLQF